MEFLPKELESYIVAHSENEPTILKDLNRETNLKILNPRMLAGHFQGRVLSMLCQMIHPTYVLEIGTYTGYSALCFAESLTENGKIHTIDTNEELEDIQTKYFNQANANSKIERHIGKALEIIPSLKYDWDLVFIDADKENYINYYNLLIDNMKSGSYIIADNVLWSGKVLETNNVDVDTKTLIQYNQMIQNDNRVQNVLFPIRDGLMICRKK